jgi:long-chain acyl-CoA synthetase
VTALGHADAAEAAKEAAAQGMALAVWAQAAPDEAAVVSELGNRTFAELNARANQVVRALRRRGLKAGDGVVVISRNRPEFAEVYAAVHRCGMRLTTVNWHLTAGEAAYIVEDCEAKAVVADARLADLAAEAVGGAAGLTTKLALGGPTGLMDTAGFEDYDAAVAAEDAGDIPDPSLGGSMLYTSGTTGRPKGVYRPQAPRTNAVLASIALSGYRLGDAHLCTGPLYHAAPLAFSLAAPLTAGAGVVLMDGWDAEETLRLIERHRITHTHMVPTMFHRLLSLPEAVRAAYDIASLRFVIHGAAPCPVPVKQRLIDWLGPIVLEYYAATEGTGTFVSSADWLARPGTVGRPDPPEQVMVGDDEGNELPRGEVGLVWLRAPDVGAFEYFKDEAKTESSYRGRYFTLGDVGRMDDDGWLYLTDRTANLIISGGVNVYPAEVDAVLLEHPAVGDVATIGVSNEEWGEEVKSVVELQPGVEPSPALAGELIEFCRARLARFKCPRSVDFIDVLPRHDNGKIYKRLLRERYRKEAE